MAIASTPTLLPLDRFARIAGIHPLHWNGVTVADLAPAVTCGDPFMQYNWQAADRSGREEVAETIADVEARLEDYLNFAVRPRYYAEEIIDYPRPRNPDLMATSLYESRGLVRAIKVGTGYLISGGEESKTLQTAATAVTYTDADSDGYAETATVTVTVNPAVVKTSEVAIYYPGTGADDAYEIRPTVVMMNPITGVTTIVCRREQLVKLELIEGLFATAIDGLDNSSFLTTLDVYRHWLDFTQQQVEFRWEQTPWQPGNQAVDFAVQGGAMLVREARLGWVDFEPGHWDAVSGEYLTDAFNTMRMPDTVRAWFQAGFPLDAKGNMDSKWERAITYLTLASLNRPLCQCDALRAFTEYWSFDAALNTPEGAHQISKRNLDTPLGTTRAAIYAWNLIQRLKLPDAVG